MAEEEQTISSVSMSSVSVDADGVTTVSTLKVRRWAKTLHHKNLARSMGAIASLAGAISVLIGAIATRFQPHGWAHLKMSLHLAKKPLLLQVAPYIAGFAVATATVAGLLSFYSWYRDNRDARQAAGQMEEAS